MTIEAIRQISFFAPIQRAELVALVGASGYEPSNTPRQTLRKLRSNEAKLMSALLAESIRMSRDPSRTDDRFLELKERYQTSRLELFFARGGSHYAKRLEGAVLGEQNG